MLLVQRSESYVPYGDLVGSWEVIYTGKQSVDMLGK